MLITWYLEIKAKLRFSGRYARTNSERFFLIATSQGGQVREYQKSYSSREAAEHDLEHFVPSPHEWRLSSSADPEEIEPEGPYWIEEELTSCWPRL